MLKVYTNFFVMFTVVFACLGSEQSFAANKTSTSFKVGQHYKKLPDRIVHHEDVKVFVGENKNKVHALMFFSYGCYWCSQLNKPFDNWSVKQSSNIKTHIFPVAFNKGWLILAKGFFTAQTLDHTGALDDSVFTAIHEQRLPLWQEKNLEDFFVSRGVEREKFKQTFNSFSIDSKVKQADELSLAFEIDATPNIVVYGPNGAYMTNLSMTQNTDELFEVMDYLVKKVEPFSGKA